MQIIAILIVRSKLHKYFLYRTTDKDGRASKFIECLSDWEEGIYKFTFDAKKHFKSTNRITFDVKNYMLNYFQNWKYVFLSDISWKNWLSILKFFN